MTDSHAPKLSVVMPLYNAARYLRPALESILNQTYTDFEFIIVDDCSTDETPAILDSYPDPRIVRLRNPQNLGIVGALNRGLDAARGQYIARMDGDDIALPERFAQQVAWLDAHPNVGLLGTLCRIFTETGEWPCSWCELPGMRCTPVYMRWALLWRTAIQHPTAMMRRSVMDAHRLRYDPRYETAEDFDLWTRFARVCDVEVLPRALLRYRVNPSSITSTRTQYQLEVHYSLIQREVGALMGDAMPPDALLRFLFRVMVSHNVSLAEAARGVDILAAMDAYYAMQERFKARYPLTRQDARSLAADARWMLRRSLLFAAHSDTPAMRRKVRARILRHSPRLFAALIVEYVVAKLKR